MNMPYLAFVALEDIPARVELNVDYNPAAAHDIGKGKGKGKAKAPDGAIPCLCGTAQCRLWV
jgi:histone-lysine N-methyltransferase SUV39H